MADMLRLEGRIEIHDYCETGKIVIDWALGRRERPASIAEFEKQLEGYATVPPGRYHELEFVQSHVIVDPDGKPRYDKDGNVMRKLFVRLPERELLQQSIDAARDFDERGAGRSALQSFYGLPHFYEDLYRGTGATETLEELLQCRIGDYTIAHCK